MLNGEEDTVGKEWRTFYYSCSPWIELFISYLQILKSKLTKRQKL